MASTDVIEISMDLHQSLFVLYKKQDRGFFEVKNLSNVRFEYNTFQGLLIPVSTGQPQGINTFFNPLLFDYITQPSQDVMTLLARLEMLIALKNIGDRGISQIIADQMDQPSYHSSKLFCDKTITNIMHLLKPSWLRFHAAPPVPTYHVILSVLNGVEKPIQSKEEAVKIMKAIYEKLNLDANRLISK